MSETVIKAENISKQYQLGQVGTNTLKGDMQRWWYNMRGKPDPTLQIGVENKLNTIDGEYVWALRDINFEIKQGEVVGIIGKNGAGKSTLLKIISRITAPTTGQIKVKGRIASLLEVGTGFHGELSGRENIFLNGAILGMTKAEIRSKFDEIVDFSGVEKYIDTPVKRYSSGMTVRLAFAVSAYLEPEILIVDEVLAVGDSEFQKKAIGKMKDISSGEGRTVLFVSHNLGSIQNLCNRGILLKNGGIIKDSKVDEVVSFYLQGEGYANTGDLMIRKDRVGSGEVIVNKIELWDVNGNEIINVMSGQDFEIRLYYITESLLVDKIIPGIALLDQLDIPILLHHSRLNNNFFSIKKGEGYFAIKFTNFQLNVGKYKLTYSLMKEGNCIDSIPNSRELVVENGDFYKTGEIVPHSHGLLLLNAKWTTNYV